MESAWHVFWSQYILVLSSVQATEYLEIETREAEDAIIIIVIIIIALGTYVARSVLGTSCLLTHLIFRMTPCGRYYFFISI